MTLALLAAIVSPALLAVLLFTGGRTAAAARAVAPWAALPTLLLALLPIGYPEAVVPGVLLGMRVAVDPIARTFLVVAALLWSTAGVYARAYVTDPGRRRFLFFWLLTMTGNFGLIVAADAASFYAFFAVMTFSAYGLVVHRGDREAARAGRIYLVLAVGGEAFLLAGLVMAVQAAGSLEMEAIRAAVAGSSRPGLITLCILLGFAVKAGAVPLHVWLPLAHPVAPTPASAVLSGSMIKAGLLGWIRFLPLGEVAQPGWGAAVIALGIVAAFFGVVVGFLQTDPKTVLAYSSISQMGVMNVGIGIALAAPEQSAAAVAAVALYAAHHGLAKGALFLGVGVAGAEARRPTLRRAVLAGLLFSAVALAGAPLTSGHAAKGALKYLLPYSPGAWSGWLDVLLPLSAGATTLLMLRFLRLVTVQWTAGHEHRLVPSLWAPWTALLGASALLVAAPELLRMGATGEGRPYLEFTLVDLVPLAGGALIFWLLLRLRPEWATLREPRIAPGDILNPLEWGLAAIPRPHRAVEVVRHGGLVPGIARRWYLLYSQSEPGDLLVRLETGLTRWAAAVALLVLFAALTLMLLVGGAG